MKKHAQEQGAYSVLVLVACVVNVRYRPRASVAAGVHRGVRNTEATAGFRQAREHVQGLFSFIITSNALHILRIEWKTP